VVTSERLRQGYWSAPPLLPLGRLLFYISFSVCCSFGSTHILESGKDSTFINSDSLASPCQKLGNPFQMVKELSGFRFQALHGLPSRGHKQKVSCSFGYTIPSVILPKIMLVVSTRVASQVCKSSTSERGTFLRSFQCKRGAFRCFHVKAPTFRHRHHFLQRCTNSFLATEATPVRSQGILS
jgi:hypothetical protein